MFLLAVDIIKIHKIICIIAIKVHEKNYFTIVNDQKYYSRYYTDT